MCRALNQDKPFDVIVLDELMPDMNGTSLLKIIRISEKYNPFHIGKRAKFIIVSAVKSQKDLKNLYKKVIDDRCVYIKKPLEPNELLEIVKNLLS